jgi:group I intron endonuclease
LGTKQTEEAKELISKALKGRLFSTESKTKMQEVVKLRQGIKTSFFGKSHTVETRTRISVTKSLIVKVTDVKMGTYKTFRGNAQAAKYLKIGEFTLRRYKRLGKLLNGKYLISNVKI